MPLNKTKLKISPLDSWALAERQRAWVLETSLPAWEPPLKLGVGLPSGE